MYIDVNKTDLDPSIASNFILSAQVKTSPSFVPVMRLLSTDLKDFDFFQKKNKNILISSCLPRVFNT